MDVRELIEHKHKLESDISASVSRLVEDFKKQTGVSPKWINIKMTPVVELGRVDVDYVVTKSCVELDV